MTIDAIERAEALQQYDSHFNQIDYEIATKEQCPVHHENCNFAGFKRGDSYRAFLYCPVNTCEHYQEF